MAGEFRGPPEWTASQISRWNAINEASNNPELQADTMVQVLYDLAFNTPKGEIAGDIRASAIESLREYLLDEYDVDFATVFDWRGWREEYGES